MRSPGKAGTRTTHPRRLEGEVVADVPLSLRVTGWGLIGLVAVVIAFAAFAQYSRRETVSGWISPEAGLIRVTAQRGGIIERLAVAEERRVSSGGLIAVLRLSDGLEDGADAGASLGASLGSEAEALDALHRAEFGELRVSEAQLAERRRRALAEAGELETGLELLERQKEIVTRQLARVEELTRKGFVSQQMLDDRRNAILDVDRQISATRGSLIARRAEGEDFGVQILALRERRAALEAQSAQAAAAFAQRRLSTTSASRYSVVAPVDGTIALLPLKVGQSTEAGGAVAVIAPHGSRLLAEMFVPSRSSGFLRSGQEVRLMLQAFPHQKFGPVGARITAVSSVAMDPREIRVPGLSFQEPMVRVLADLDVSTIEIEGEPVSLRPGMLLKADIILDRRSLLEWLFEPMLSAGRR